MATSTLTDLDEMLQTLAADVGLPSFSASTKPTEAQIIYWINDGILDVIRLLCPRRMKNGEWTEGRTDRLLKLMMADSRSTGTEFTGQMSLPDNPICFFLGIKYGTAGSEVRAQEVPLIELLERDIAGSPFTITTATPVYSWSGSGIRIEPAADSKIVDFHYLVRPTAMAQTTNEDFPIENDLFNVVMDYVRTMIWSQNQRNIELAALHAESYYKQINELIGEANATVAGHTI